MEESYRRGSPCEGRIGQPTQGVNVDKLGLYSPAERASRTERHGQAKRKGGETRPRKSQWRRKRERDVCVEKEGKRRLERDGV